MQNVDGKVVIITGASSGIGAETARVLVANGAKVVLSARRGGHAGNLREQPGPVTPDGVAPQLTTAATARAPRICLRQPALLRVNERPRRRHKPAQL